MYLLYCDETNFQKLSGDFFVYGGIAVKGDKAKELADELAAIRHAFGVEPEFVLKFNPGPDEMAHQEFINLKKAYMAAAVKHEVKLLVNLLLHDIATNSDEARRNGINTLRLITPLSTAVMSFVVMMKTPCSPVMIALSDACAAFVKLSTSSRMLK